MHTDYADRRRRDDPRRLGRLKRTYLWAVLGIYARCGVGLLLASALLFSLWTPSIGLEGYSVATSVAARIVQGAYLLGLVGAAVSLHKQLTGGVLMVVAGISVAAAPIEGFWHLYTPQYLAPPGVQLPLFFCGALMIALGARSWQRRIAHRLPAISSEVRSAQRPLDRRLARRFTPRFRLASLMLATAFTALVCGMLTATEGVATLAAAAAILVAAPLVCGAMAPQRRRRGRVLLASGAVATVVFCCLTILLTQKLNSSGGALWLNGMGTLGLAPPDIGAGYASLPYYACLWNAALLGAPLACVTGLGVVSGMVGWQLRAAWRGERRLPDCQGALEPVS